MIIAVFSLITKSSAVHSYTALEFLHKTQMKKKIVHATSCVLDLISLIFITSTDNIKLFSISLLLCHTVMSTL